MSKSLFEEAIADAKQLRDVAEQNAKKAIVEAVTPRIKEFIEMQLVNEAAEIRSDNSNFLVSSLNEADDQDEEDVIIPPKKVKKEEKNLEESDEVELSESALAALVGLVSAKKSKVDPLQSALGKLSESERQTLLRIARGESLLENLEKDGKKSEQAKHAMPTKTESGEKKMRTNKQDLYELDLDSLDEDKIVIDFGKDIELDKENPYTVLVTSSDEEEEGEVTLEEPPEEEGEVAPMPPESGEEEAPPEDEEEKQAMDEMIYELDENVLRAALLQLREAKKTKKPESKKPAAAKAFGDGEVMDEVVMNKFSHLKEAYNNEVRKNRALQQQLNEYRNAIETLREQLSELNLFNAKLLFVNKISQSRDISAAQRKAVVEALDGAKNLREAKLIYTSLSESLDKGNSATLSESARRLSPGHASRPTSSGGSTRLNESTQLDRWATLAGLK